MKRCFRLAHWPLNQNGNEKTRRFDAENKGVLFTGSEAVFNGSAALTVPDSPPLRLGTNDFSILLRFRADRPIAGSPGTLLSKFDPTLRNGLAFLLASETPGYCGTGDTVHLQFGLDDGYTGAWTDCGQPEPENPLITALTPYEGALYAGIADALDPQRAAHVYRWEGGTQWTDCGRLGNDPACRSVMSLLAHNGHLYAGSGCWDWERASGRWPGFKPAFARVYLWEGGTQWKDLGQIGTSARVLSLAGFDGNLFAGLDRRGGGHVFRLHNGRWEDLGAPNGDNVENLLGVGSTLYAATHQFLFQWHGGDRWQPIAERPFDVSQIHAIALFNGRLHLGTWPQGFVLRLEPDGRWINTGRLGLPPDTAAPDCNEVNDLCVHNGKLYAGVIPKAEVYRYEHDGVWTLMGRLGGRPDWSPFNYETWCRVTALASFDGLLMAGTGSCHGRAGPHVNPEGSLGRVCALQTGLAVAYHRDVGSGWNSVAVRRRGRRLDLFLNGLPVASAESPERTPFTVSNTAPLELGNGTNSAFRGAMRDVQIWIGALPDETIAEWNATGTMGSTV